MARSLFEREGLSDPDKKFLGDIETWGWNVTTVFAGKGDEGPDWAFSTGLYNSYGHPEVVMFGLPRDRMHTLINEIGSQVKAGTKFEPGREYSGVFASCGCSFRSVDQAHYRNYLGWAIWFYQQDSFPVLQCFWPDRSGHYPWDPDCEAAVSNAQPLLFKPS